MAELSKIRKNGVDYDIKDTTAREAIKNIPKVSTADAGKFLRVSANGTWAVEALTDVSEVGA